MPARLGPVAASCLRNHLPDYLSNRRDEIISITQGRSCVKQRQIIGCLFAATLFAGPAMAHELTGTLKNLKGKSVVSTSGTTNIKQLTEANAARNLNINIIPAKDHAESFLMVETDRAVAFVMDDILLASLIAGSKAPDDYVISKDAFSKPEPYGIMLRKDDPAFKKVVDGATAALYKSGEAQKIYDKWFTQKIPPKNLNLNVPISSELKNEFAKPSDSPDPDSYK